MKWFLSLLAGFLGKCYRSVDELPVYNWFKLHETGDLIYIVKRGWCSGAARAESWDKCYRSFFDTFGVSDDFREYLELQRDIAILKADKVVDGDASLQTKIDIKEMLLAQMLETKTKKKLNEVKVFVEKWMGFRLDERVVTVKEYYTYLYALEKETKRIPG